LALAYGEVDRVNSQHKKNVFLKPTSSGENLIYAKPSEVT